MVSYEKHSLPNGLRILVHRDDTTPMAAVNILYNVGARDEDPERTGFAHLFEHLMFEGSKNIPDYDRRLQHAGGENNAFTTNDITNYYLSLPAQNLEVAFWLESDRMLGLAFSEEKLATQKNVVVEEFRQSFLNQPYGDAGLLLRPLAYEIHPYRWPTIGKDISHIQEATLEEVRQFFHAHYHPGNAILSVSGNVIPEEVFRLAGKWFGELPGRKTPQRKLPAEPLQRKQKRLVVQREVPQHQLIMSFHTCSRLHPDFHATDLLSDVLANGDSSRLIRKLVNHKKYFSEANAYVTGSLDPGQLVISARLHKGVDPVHAEEILWKELALLAGEPLGERELEKVKNKVETTHTFSESNHLAKAMNLAYYELMGEAGLLNLQMEKYARVSPERLQKVAAGIFTEKNASVLHYEKANGIKGKEIIQE